MTIFASKNFDDWNQAIVSNFCHMGFSKMGSGFHGVLAVNDLIKTQLCAVDTNSEFIVSRNKSHIGRVNDALYLVKFQLIGQSVIEHRNHSAHLTPGDFIICSTAEPYKLHLEDNNRQAVLTVPEPVMKQIYAEADDFLGVKMDKQKAPHSILSTMIQGLVEQGGDMPPQILQRLESNILDMLGTSLYAEATRNDTLSKNTKSVHIEDIKRTVNLNLNNPSLSIDFIANQLHVSTRYLHMLFKEQDVSISKYILHQRIEACAKALTHPDYQHYSSTEIAMEWCFADASHFNRCFKAYYGLTPRQYRLQH